MIVIILPFFSKSDPSVGVFYYVWYKNGNEWENIKDWPIIGFYNSSNKDVIEYHISLMRRYNVNLIIVSWFGKNSKTDKVLQNIVKVLEQKNCPIRFAILYESYYFNDSQNIENVLYAMNYMKSKCYLREKIIFLYVKDVNVKVDKIVVNPLYLPYWSPVPKKYRNFVTIVPEYDETRLPGRIGIFLPRVFEEQISIAKFLRPKKIIVTSWNEFYENTHIEPSFKRAFYYLKNLDYYNPIYVHSGIFRGIFLFFLISILSQVPLHH